MDVVIARVRVVQRAAGASCAVGPAIEQGRKPFEQGGHLCREGAPADRFYVIRFGVVSVETFAPTRGPVTIETAGAGDVLGWSWLFPPHKWHFDVRAQTLVRALALDGVCLRGKCEADPVLGYEMVKRFAEVVVRRLEATQLQLLDLYGKPA